MALDAHKIANSDHDLLDLLCQLASGGEDEGLAGLDAGIDLLQDRDGESGSLAGTGLSLSNDIVTCLCGERQYDGQKNTKMPVLCLPLITGMIARCWIADGRSKP